MMLIKGHIVSLFAYLNLDSMEQLCISNEVNIFSIDL